MTAPSDFERAAEVMGDAMDEASIGGTSDPELIALASGFNRDMACRALTALLAALPGMGWHLTPIFPTEKQSTKGAHANSEWLNDNAPIGESRYRKPAEAVYAAMLFVAPKFGEKTDDP